MLRAFSTCLLLGVLATAAQAEVQRVEAVGSYGIRESMRSKVIPRDEAIASALWEGVSRVALELMGESALDPTLEDERSSPADRVVPPLEGRSAGDDEPDERAGRGTPTDDQVALLESALGKDTLPYTQSFRILKDRGEKPVLFADDPGIKTEYVVVVEVLVDADRVTRALEQAGLIAAQATLSSGEAVTLEVTGLAQHPGLSTMVATLRDRLGATQVQPIEFGREFQVLRVRGPFGAEGLADRLRGARSNELRFDSIAVDRGAGRVRAHAEWSEPEEPN